MKGRIWIVAVVVAAVAAAGVAFFLKQEKQAVIEKTFTPVVVAAPDLYPADTLLFAAVHHMDESWDFVESWWKRFEPTATWHLAEKQWNEARAQKGLPPSMEEAVAAVETAMKETEARLGRRPNTKEFFQTYGKYLSFGLLPGTGEAKPRMLVVVKLPGEADMAALKASLGGVSAVKRHEPPDLHGYPVWSEERASGTKVFYGVGGGYLFVSDDAEALSGSLGRLEALVASAKGPAAAAPSPSLSSDAVFRRGVPGEWEQVRIALFVRKDQQFARWSPKFARTDDAVRRAFAVAPADPALALSAIRSGAGDVEVHSSFAPTADPRRPWEESLPAGSCVAWMSAPPKEPLPREKALADLDRFRGKAIWRECDALLRDTPRLKLLLGEALGPEAVPADEVLRRLPADGEFLAAAFRSLAEGALLSPDMSFAFAQKVYDGDSTEVETVVATTVSPATTLYLVTLFDNLIANKQEIAGNGPFPLTRVEESGVHAWRFGLREMIKAMSRGNDPDARTMDSTLAPWEPGLVVAGGRAWITFGEKMFADVRALAAGRAKALSTDALFVEAAATVPQGATTRTYTVPAESYRGAFGGLHAQTADLLAKGEAPPKFVEIHRALFSALDEWVRWQRSTKAVMSASFADPARADEAAALMDPAREKESPRFEMAAAPMAATDVLPSGTFFLGEGRIDVRPTVEAFVAAFLKALPGGRAKWDEFRKELEVPTEEVEARIDALLVDVRGEAGFAVVAPTVADPLQVKGNQDLLDRIPGFVLFAAYAHPDAAFEKAVGILDKAAEMSVAELPYEEQRKQWEEGQARQPFGTVVERTQVGGNDMATFRVRWPEGPRAGDLGVGAAVVRRGDLLYFCTSLPVARLIASAAPGAEGTLGARIRKELPAGTLPADGMRLLLFRHDGFADCFALYARPLAPNMAGLSLQGVQEPTPERMAAHQKGWSRAAELIEDLFRTGEWSVGVTVREQDVVRTRLRRVAGR
jgi:hypothetical protein